MTTEGQSVEIFTTEQTVVVEPESQTLEIQEAQQTVVVELVEQRVEVLSVGVQGPPGPPGADGPMGPTGPVGPSGVPDRLFYVRVAAENLGGHRAVMGNLDGTVSYADANIPAHVGKVLGITTFAVLEGEEVDIIRQGPIEFIGWSWDVDTPIYLAGDGLLTQTPTATGFSQIVGFAESPTVLFVNLREPILLT